MSRAHSNKAKGRNGQKEVQELILKHFPELHPDDCRSNPMGAQGEDLLLSPLARRTLGNIQIEVKRSKRIAACRYMEQANEHGDYKPVAFFREDRGPWFACVYADFLLELLRKLDND